MNPRPLLALLLISAIFPCLAPAAEGGGARLYEMRTYYSAPGKLEELHARFRDHTVQLFARHGMENIGYWTPIENPENKLIYVLGYASREARDAAWKAFLADPEWQGVHKASEANGKLVSKVEQLFLAPTDFSPEIKPSTGAAPRIFELRTYTTTAGNLPLLHARFREHTQQLFARHGMTNLFYWQLAPGQQPGVTAGSVAANPDNTLVYLLAHASIEAAKASFDAFRADPEWIAVKKASEEKGGGSLTVPDGVKSVFLQATDYSPTR